MKKSQPSIFRISLAWNDSPWVGGINTQWHHHRPQTSGIVHINQNEGLVALIQLKKNSSFELRLCMKFDNHAQ